MFIEILFKIVLFKGGVLIYAEHCVYIYIYIYIYIWFYLLPSFLKEDNYVFYKVNKYILNTCLNV